MSRHKNEIKPRHGLSLEESLELITATGKREEELLEKMKHESAATNESYKGGMYKKLKYAN